MRSLLNIFSIVKSVIFRRLFQKLKYRTQPQSHKLPINSPARSAGVVKPVEPLETPRETHKKYTGENFDAALFEAAARSTSSNYAPSGESHKFKSPMASERGRPPGYAIVTGGYSVNSHVS